MREDFIFGPLPDDESDYGPVSVTGERPHRAEAVFYKKKKKWKKILKKVAIGAVAGVALVATGGAAAPALLAVGSAVLKQKAERKSARAAAKAGVATTDSAMVEAERAEEGIPGVEVGPPSPSAPTAGVDEFPFNLPVIGGVLKSLFKG